MEVDFLDVGQGDSILIKTAFGQNILIDGGPDKTILRRLSENLPWWDRQIDLMILTHPHEDHLVGINEVMNRYVIKKIIYNGAIDSNPSYVSFIQKIREKNIPTYIAETENIGLGEDSRLKILYPVESLAGQALSNQNNGSIAIKLEYQDNEWLFMGDAENEAEYKMIKQAENLSADLIKIGHHGSDTATSEDFLKKVKPELAIIQVGANNDFRHPSPRTIKKLLRQGVRIYRTDLDGTIRSIGNGKTIEIKTKR